MFFEVLISSLHWLNSVVDFLFSESADRRIGHLVKF
jgi:hypothetical protein